jgi:hypothetical protein
MNGLTYRSANYCQVFFGTLFFYILNVLKLLEKHGYLPDLRSILSVDVGLLRSTAIPFMNCIDIRVQLLHEKQSLIVYHPPAHPPTKFFSFIYIHECVTLRIVIITSIIFERSIREHNYKIFYSILLSKIA